MHEQNEKFNKEIDTNKNPKQTEILELKNALTVLKDSIESFNSILNQGEEKKRQNREPRDKPISI